MASKKYLDKGGLEHTWNKIKTYLTSNYAKINVRLIEKRVVTTSGAVSIPAGTRAIAYASIGGGGGGGGGSERGGGGGGGSGSAAGGAGGASGSVGAGVGGSGGRGEIGFIYNFAGLSISAVIGAGGAGGGSGSAAGAGGNSYVIVSGSSNAFTLIIADRANVYANGNAGGAGVGGSGGAGGTALTVLGATAGAGGKGGNANQNGSAGGNGAIIFFFYS